MMAYTPISTCTKNVSGLIRSAHRQTSGRVLDALLQVPSNSYCYKNVSNTFYASKSYSVSPVDGLQALNKHKVTSLSLKFKRFVSPGCCRKTSIDVSTGYQNMNLRLSVQKHTKTSEITCNTGPVSFKQRGLSAGLFICLLVCYSSSEPSYAEASQGNKNKEDDRDASPAHCSHGKKVLTDYSVIGIPGDGRCLFRSVAHGACIQSGKPAPNENLQRELADELRDRVADEFVKRREETEWFIEGDFDTYISQMRKPHVWGGEPELLMASHVLQMPITVYMHDQDSGGLISIAEYGQEYGKDNPIKVLYHGFGHYDALHFPQKGGARPRL